MRDLIIVGGGPAGLAAAIAAKAGGLDYEVLEKGLLVNSLHHFPKHMVFFTTPELLEIGGLPFVTPYEKPTRFEALRYYRRVVDACGVSVELGQQVLRVTPETAPPAGFVVETRGPHERGTTLRRARTVVMATGCYDNPNRLGVPGEELPHVSHYYSEAHPYYRQKVVIVGGKNSAAEAALDLYRSGANVTLVHRRSTLGDSIKYWVRPDIENRIKEGSVAARFDTTVVAITPTEVLVRSGDRDDRLEADAVLLLTGYHAKPDMLVEAGVRVDPTSLVPEHDPETFETNVPGLFLAGTVVSGIHSGKVFIENGRFHGDVVVQHIRRRLSRVEV